MVLFLTFRGTGFTTARILGRRGCENERTSSRSHDLTISRTHELTKKFIDQTISRRAGSVLRLKAIKKSNNESFTTAQTGPGRNAGTWVRKPSLDRGCLCGCRNRP